MENKDLEKVYSEWLEKKKKFQDTSRPSYRTISGIPIKDIYTPKDIENTDYLKDIGFPGEYPYTRGIHYNMYRGKIWTMRMFAGFGRAKDTNERFKFLIKQGQTGLSTAFDMPTLMGYDSDDPRAEGEVGREGVAVDTLADFEILFDGINLAEVSTSFTINSPAIFIYALYLAIAEKQGVPFEKIRGTLQNDILKEYHAQNEFIFPPEPSVKLIVDIMEFSSRHTPKFNTVSVSGYHIREAGSTAVQELAFTLADGFAYVEAGIRRGLDVDSFAPRISFFFNAHIDFFEEIAKYRAARRIWAREMKNRYKAKNPQSLLLRFHTQTAGCSLTAQQPLNNIIRTTIEALAAVLGGTQSLHTNSYDEALQLPSEEAVTIALRTQQIIAYESGVINTVDPLAGSYFVEALTNEVERQAYEYFNKILEMGNGSFLDGVINAIYSGYIKKEIADAAYEFQKRVEEKDFIIVGVNEYIDENETIEPPKFKIEHKTEIEQREFLKHIKETRDNLLVRHKIEELKNAAKRGDNLVPYVLDAVKVYATEQEIIETLKSVYGVFREVVVL
ncbi:MAG: methylmalonyl-CoA mutase family protein [candidate division WOR-3 bacterium]|nr:methylmalonyl-CoA mutase family protein [candidate division WOR-3 bacterium]MDW8150773.1 methylmalonyl-CoA mutase family protein [candidate division WOR-3 bacterium]